MSSPQVELLLILDAWVLQMEPGSENTLLSSCGDGSFSVWDVRKLGRKMRPVATESHWKTCSSAYFSPTGIPPQPAGWSSRAGQHAASWAGSC